jgi:hypothetical protein
MQRPVERFLIRTPPILLNEKEEPAGRTRRLRSGAAEPEAVGIAAMVCWLFSLGLVGYAAWLLASLWLSG